MHNNNLPIILIGLPIFWLSTFCQTTYSFCRASLSIDTLSIVSQQNTKSMLSYASNLYNVSIRATYIALQTTSLSNIVVNTYILQQTVFKTILIRFTTTAKTASNLHLYDPKLCIPSAYLHNMFGFKVYPISQIHRTSVQDLTEPQSCVSVSYVRWL